MPSNYIHIKNNALELVSMFPAQYICEMFFSSLKLRKNYTSNKIGQDSLNSCLRIASLNNLQSDFENKLFWKFSDFIMSFNELNKKFNFCKLC